MGSARGLGQCIATIMNEHGEILGNSETVCKLPDKKNVFLCIIHYQIIIVHQRPPSVSWIGQAFKLKYVFIYFIYIFYVFYNSAIIENDLK